MTQTPATFDDCTTFPREGCSGTRQGTQAIVAYEGITLTYRLANDALLVTIEGADNALNPWLMGQDHPQRVFLTIPGGGSVHYYQDGTWRLLRPADGSAPESDVADQQGDRRLRSRTSRPSTARCTSRRHPGRPSSSTALGRARRPRMRTARRC